MSGLPTSLLLVPDDGRSDLREFGGPGELNRMLVHLDGTDVSDRVLDRILDHVIGIASEETVCHLRSVVPLSTLYSSKRGELPRRSDIPGKAWLVLSHARERLERHGIHCTTRVIFDGEKLASTIAAQARAMQAIVVVAAARRHLLPRWLRTDVADSLAREADVPILIVPRDGSVATQSRPRNGDLHSN